MYFKYRLFRYINIVLVTSEISAILSYFSQLFNVNQDIWVKLSISFGNVIPLYISTSPKQKLRYNTDVINYIVGDDETCE